MGSPTTSPPFVQDGCWWEGICIQILPWQTWCIHCCGQGIWCRRYKGNLLLSLWPIGLFEANATCCIYCLEDLLKERPLFRWSGLAQIACLSATTLSRPGMCRALGVTCFWCTRSRFSIVETQVGPTSCLLPCLCMTPLWCCLSLQLLFCVCRGLGTQCVRLCKRPTLLLMHL